MTFVIISGLSSKRYSRCYGSGSKKKLSDICFHNEEPPRDGAVFFGSRYNLLRKSLELTVWLQKWFSISYAPFGESLGSIFLRKITQLTVVQKLKLTVAM